MSDAPSPDELKQWDADAQRLTDMVLAMPASELDQSIAGEWSPRQVLAHLLDAEVVFSTRMRAAIVQPGSLIALFDQDEMAIRVPYTEVSIEAIGAAFTALRRINTAIALALPSSAWDETVEHPERGTQSLVTIARVFGPHISDHLPELQATASSRE